MLYNLSKKNVAIYLIVIGLISLGFKLYLVDFSFPVHADDLSYTLHAISLSHGNFAQNPERGSGWPLFASPFTLLVSSDSLIDYSNVMRILSLSIATFTIFPVYLVCRNIAFIASRNAFWFINYVENLIGIYATRN